MNHKASGQPEALIISGEKPTVWQISEVVEKVRKIKSLLFRHFIHVNLGIVVKVYQNLPFSYKNV